MDHKPSAHNQQMRAKGRRAGLLIAGTMGIWLAAQIIGPALGLGGKWAVLVDLMAIAAFTFALIVTYQLWRARQDDEGE